MKKIKKNIYLLNLTLFLCTIISCTQNKDPIEVRIETHKINLGPHSDVGEMTKEEFQKRKSKAEVMNPEHYLLSEILKI